MTKVQANLLKTLFSAVEEIQERAVVLSQEMQDAIDNKSDKWRDSEAGELASEQQNNVQSFTDYLENAKDQIGQYVVD